MHNIPIHLIPGKTIGDGITDSLRETQETFESMPEYDPILAVRIADYYREIRKFAIEAVHLTLYICAENAEIAENETQKKIYRKPTKTTDRFREIRKWDVGVKTGEILRKIERDRKRISPAPRT